MSRVVYIHVHIFFTFIHITIKVWIAMPLSHNLVAVFIPKMSAYQVSIIMYRCVW